MGLTILAYQRRKQMNSKSLWDLDPFKFNTTTVGFDGMVKKLQQSMMDAAPQGYPPYNIKKVDSGKYVIEMAVAGFGKSDIEITLKDGKLVVEGKAKSDDVSEYLHKGIAERGFNRSFTLADKVEVNNADMINGMLRIWLDFIAEQEAAPKKIKINEPPENEVSKSELLQETKKSGE